MTYFRYNKSDLVTFSYLSNPVLGNTIHRGSVPVFTSSKRESCGR